MRIQCLALLALLLLASAACHKRAPVARPPSIGSTETGVASWYGHPYHGRRAANGEIYDMEKLTAAHRTLPFDTWVRVKNLTNEKTIDVRITDRGPFVDNRVIDLSHAAARAIDMIGPGVVKVQLTIIAPPPREELPATDLFTVQVGAFQDRARAERIRADMETRYGSARIVERAGNPPLWRVLVGQEPSTESAAGLAARISAEGGAAFVVRLDSGAGSTGTAPQQ